VEDKLWQQLEVCKKIKKSIKLRKLEKKNRKNQTKLKKTGFCSKITEPNQNQSV
jgi:hypothetical protein